MRSHYPLYPLLSIQKLTLIYAKRKKKASHAFVFPSKPKFGILSEGKERTLKASHIYREANNPSS